MFQVQLGLITKLNPLCFFSHRMSFRGGMGNTRCSLMRREGVQENRASPRISSWERCQVRQVSEMMFFFSSLKGKNRETRFSPDYLKSSRKQPPLSREQTVSLIYLDEIFFFFFLNLPPYLRELLFKMSWASFEEQSLDSSGRGLLSSTSVQLELKEKVLAIPPVSP